MNSLAPVAITMVDIVIAVTALEALALWAYHRYTGKGIPGRDFMPTLLSGLLLMLALRTHMADAGWGPTALLMAGAGLLHALDLRRRWRAADRPHHAISRPS